MAGSALVQLKNAKASFICISCGNEALAPKETDRATVRQCKPCFGKRKDLRKNQLNDLTGSEWAALSKSVEQFPGTRSDKQRAHGAAFPQSLAEANISIYSQKGGVILDPFVGVGTTIDAAAKLGRRAIGLELNPEFVKLARKDIKNKEKHKVICDDARNLRSHVKKNSVDFILTSPPYATLLKTIKGEFGYKWREHSKLSVMSNPTPYSRHKSDLGNLDYGAFLEALMRIQKDCFDVLKPGSYSAWVIKDYRNLKNNVPYVNFHGDVIRVAEAAGFVLWDIRIYDQTKFRPLVVLGYPSRNYYLNIGHSYILVFRKSAKEVAKK